MIGAGVVAAAGAESRWRAARAPGSGQPFGARQPLGARLCRPGVIAGIGSRIARGITISAIARGEPAWLGAAGLLLASLLAVPAQAASNAPAQPPASQASPAASAAAPLSSGPAASSAPWTTAVLLAPPVLAGARLQPVAYADLAGWREDDATAAFATFLKSCAALGTPQKEEGPASVPTLRAGLVHACAAAARLGTKTPAPMVARLFFEAAFRPFRVIPDKGGQGFFTGYYEPEIEGALAPDETFTVPVYGRPKDLVMEHPAANSGAAGRMVDGKLQPYFDRAAIEDGALAGRGLEIAWLKDPVDLFFMQIQGSGRVRLPDGRVLRLNYDGYNGYPYVPVGRLLIARGIVPRAEMSMDRIRAFMEADPEAGRALRRENPSYVFFKALDLPEDAGAMGAQGVPLTAGRSLAVDRHLHTYGSPVFVEAELPLSGPGAADPFDHLMIAQDTGSAIRGPARADLFLGAGATAGAAAGRIRHEGRFTLLVPRLAPGTPQDRPR